MRGILRIWDLATGKPVEEIPFPARIFDTCLDRESRRVAVYGAPGNRDDTEPFVAVYDYRARRLVYLTPPGRLETGPRHRIVFGRDAGTVWLGPSQDDRYADLESGSVAVSGDRADQVARLGRREFEARLAESEPAVPGSLQLLDVADVDGGIALVREDAGRTRYGVPQRAFLHEADTGLPLVALGHKARPIAGYGISPSGAHLLAWQEASLDRSEALYLWDLHSMTCRVFPDLEEVVGEKRVESVVLTEDGTIANVVIGKGYGNRGGSEKEIVRLSLSGDKVAELSRSSGLGNVLWDEDQRGAVLWKEDGIYDYDPASGEARRVAARRENEWIVSFSPDRRHFWREYRREDLANSNREEDWMIAQGVELVERESDRTVVRLPARSFGIVQNIRVHYDAEGMLVGSEVKLATGGFTRSELNWVTYGGEVRSFPIAEPEGAMLIWSGLIESEGKTFACAARSNGILESFDFTSGEVAASFRDPEIEGWFQHLGIPATVAEHRRYLLPRKDGGFRVMRVSPEGRPERVADGLLSAGGKWLIRAASGHYWTSPGGEREVLIATDRGTFPIAHLDLAFHRPHVVARELGAPGETIKELESLWRARLARHGLDADAVPEPDRVPRIEPSSPVPFVAPGRELAIRFSLEDATLFGARLHLLVNEVPVHGRNGLEIADGKIEATIELSRGLNEVEAFVQEESGIESIHWRGRTWLSPEAASREGPALHILAVGVSDYRNDDYDLQYAAKDATDLGSRLAELGRENGFRDVRVHLVTDLEATRDGIRGAAANLRESGVDDTVILFLAGHGLVTGAGDYFFGTTDIAFEEPESAGLGYRDIQSLLDGVPARRRFVFIDTCHAGEIEEAELAGLRDDPALAARGIRVRALPGNDGSGFARPDRLVRDLFSDIRLDTGAHVLCAAQGAEFALESDETRNGLFTHFLLAKIESGEADLDGDGRILAPELVESVADEVRALTGGIQNPVSRESNDSLPFPLWPDGQQGVDPVRFLESYMELSEGAADPGKRRAAVDRFAEEVRYFDNTWSPAEIERDMADYCERYDTIRYRVRDVRVEASGPEEVVLRYVLEFHVQADPVQDFNSLQVAYKVDRQGEVPSRMVLRRDGAGWKIRELGSVSR